MVVGMNFKPYNGVGTRLKLKVKTFLGIIPTFGGVTKEKLEKKRKIYVIYD